MRAIKILLPLVILAGIGWWSIGPDWRALLANLPTDDKVLSWNQDTRKAAFRMMDQITVLVKSKEMHNDSGYVRALPQGADMPAGIDLDRHMAEQHVAGLVILKDGKIRAERYGLDFEPGRWTSFSVAKSFSSTLVGAAIKDGYINSMQDTVSTYIPALKGSPYDNVTLEQLMTMSSGIDWNEDYEDPNSDVAQFNLHQPKDGLPIIVSYFTNAKKAHEPGAKFNYSTGETNLIGILVEEATGKRISDYAAEKIWAKAGLAEMGTWLLGRDGREISGCCIQASTMDYARVGQFIAEGAVGPDGESILPAGWLEKATSSQVETPFEGEDYGYQWWTYDDGAFAARGIYGQGIFIDRANNIVIAINSNWPRASDPEKKPLRENFYRAVQAALIAE